jgi:hypothetical protein
MIRKFIAFYPEYLNAHQNHINRRLHFIGATLCFAFLFFAVITLNIIWILPAIIAGYLFPHFGHKHYEGNKSMRISNPVFCVMGATLMYFQQWKKLFRL